MKKIIQTFALVGFISILLMASGKDEINAAPGNTNTGNDKGYSNIKIEDPDGCLKAYIGTGRYKSGGVVTVKAMPSTSNEFKCWYEKETDGTYKALDTREYPLTFNVRAQGDKTFVAAGDFNITYKLDKGQENTNPVTYNGTDDEIELNKPDRTGYTFVGWTGSNGDAPEEEVSIPQGSYGDMEFEANWEPRTDTAYKVQHVVEQDDGTYKVTKEENLQGTTDTKVTPPTQKYAGYSLPRKRSMTIKPDGSATLKYIYNIKPAGEATEPETKDLVYTGESQTLIEPAQSEDGTVLYKLGSYGSYGRILPKATNAGKYTIYYKVEENEHYSDANEKSVEVEIEKAPSVPSVAPQAKSMSLAKTDQPLVRAGETTDGTILYRLGETGDFSTSIPRRRNVGIYNVYYMIKGDSNHNDSEPELLQPTISASEVETINIYHHHNQSGTNKGNNDTPAQVYSDASEMGSSSGCFTSPKYHSYSYTTKICTLTEHTHSASCYESRLTCGKDIHTHTSACYTTIVHTHSTAEGCYGNHSSIGYPHEGTDGATKYVCRYCGATDMTGEAHQDGRICSKHLICTKDTAPRQELTCTIPEHASHTSSCYSDFLICGKSEHTHTGQSTGTGCYKTESGSYYNYAPNCGMSDGQFLYDINVNLMGGTYNGTKGYSCSGSNLVFNRPQMEGFTFLGYSRSEQADSVDYAASGSTVSVPMSDMDLYAVWEEE